MTSKISEEEREKLLQEMNADKSESLKDKNYVLKKICFKCHSVFETNDLTDTRCSICGNTKETQDELFEKEKIKKTKFNTTYAQLRKRLREAKENEVIELQQQNSSEQKSSKEFIDKKNKSYYHLLKNICEDTDEFEGILKFLPEFYLLLCNLMSDERTDWFSRMLINSALAYLVLEKDIISDDKGPEGYLDDLFLCSYVLKEIRDNISINIIKDNAGSCDLKSYEDIFKLIYDIHSKSSLFLGDKTKHILNLVGLNKFTAIDLLAKDDNVRKLSNMNLKLKILYAMLAVKTEDFMFKSRYATDKKLVGVRRYISEHPEYGDIKRYINFLR